MKNLTLISILATAAVAAAQVTVDNGTYTCSKPNVAFCAGDSLKTDIIIRCDANGRGQPGRCEDNLVGEPPLGVQPALCYQSDPTVGDAACEKNCVVYGGSGNGGGDFTLPASVCTPSFTATGGGGAATTTTTSTDTDCGKCESSTSTTPVAPPVVPTTTDTLTEETTICTTSGEVAPTAPPPPPPAVVTTPTAAPVYPTGNGTVSMTTMSPVNPSATPTKPTTSGPAPISSAGAAVNVAGGLLAGLGMAVAYVL